MPGGSGTSTAGIRHPWDERRRELSTHAHSLAGLQSGAGGSPDVPPRQARQNEDQGQRAKRGKREALIADASPEETRLKEEEEEEEEEEGLFIADE